MNPPVSQLRLQRLVTWLMAALVCALGACGGAIEKSREGSSAELVVTTSQALSASDVTRVAVTITGDGIVAPIVRELVKVGGQWQGIIDGIPVGADRTFRGDAYDASSALLYRGEAHAAIARGQRTVVMLNLQQASPPARFENAAPIIDSLVASSNAIVPGDPVSLDLRAHDPDPTDAIVYAWSATGGSFVSPSSASTSWTSPGAEGVYTLTATVTDPKSASSTIQLQINVAAANAPERVIGPIQRFSGATGASWELRANHLLLYAGFTDYSSASRIFAYRPSYNLHRYDTASDVWWQLLSDTPSAAGAPVAWIGNALYGFNDAAVFRHDIGTGILVNETAVPYGSLSAAAAHDDRGHVLGFTRDGTQRIARYDIVSHTLTFVATTIVEPPLNSRIAWDSATTQLYVAPSIFAGTFAAVDIATGATTARAAHPEGQFVGALCSDRSGHIYGQGDINFSRTFWQFDTGANTWHRIADLPFSKGTNGTCTVTDDGWLYFTPGDTFQLARIRLY